MGLESAQSISDVSVRLPAVAEIVDVLTLQAGYNAAVVVAGTSFLGIAAGAIGAFALLRKRALMGDALAHSTLPGLALAFIAGSLMGIGGKQLWLLLAGATASGLVGVICVQLLVRYSRLHEDAAIGAVLSCFFGAGVLLLSIIQTLGTGEEGGLHHFIYGQTAAMNLSDAYLTLGAALLAVVICAALFKEFRLVSFDDEFAASTGWPITRIDLAMMFLVVLVTVVGLQAVGLLLIIALLVVPAAAARFWSLRLHKVVAASAFIGGLSGYLGSSASALLPRLPAGAVIVLTAGCIFGLSFLFAPERGVLAVLIARLRMQSRIAEDHLLRGIYELREARNEDPQSPGDWLPMADVRLCRSWSRLYRKFVLTLMSRRGSLETKGSGHDLEIRLSGQGLRESALKVRNHRLWEEYLVSRTDMPVSHIDYSAELVEHAISPEVVKLLEESLAAQGRRVPPMEPPPSRHPIRSEA